MNSPIQLFEFAVLLLLICGAPTKNILLVSGASQPRSGYLSTFTSRSIVRTWYGSGHLDEGAKGRIEVEEFYDRTRQLGKLVIHAQERSELYVRLKDQLYLEAHFNSNGSLKSCRSSQTRPADGYFGLFDNIANFAQRQVPIGELGYFIGPSALIYLFRNQLQAQWETKQQQEASNNNNRTSEEEDIGFRLEKNRRRLFVEKDSVELSLIDDPNLRVSFRLSSFLLERSPLLSKLAPFVAFTDQHDRIFHIDYISIEEPYLDPLISADPFKLPVGGFACLAKSSSLADPNAAASWMPTRTRELKGSAFQMDEQGQGWAQRLELSSDEMSANIYSLSLYPEGVQLALDLNKHMFRFDIIGHSRNVLNMKQKLIYHMPDEPLINEAHSWPTSSSEQEGAGANVTDYDNAKDADLEIVGVRNEKCSIIASETFGGMMGLARNDNNYFESLSRWHFFVGNTNSMMYLGKTRHISGHLAHEFELSYTTSNELPSIFMVLLSQEWRESKTLSEEGTILLGRLWLSFDSCPVDLHSPSAACRNPILLAYRLELLGKNNNQSQEPITNLRSEEISLGEFQWVLSEEGMAKRSSAHFDISRCPLSKLRIQLEVRWMEVLGVTNTNAMRKTAMTASTQDQSTTLCSSSYLKDLDEFVADEWNGWMDSYFSADSGTGGTVVGFERHSIPGVKAAKYFIELAENPQLVIKFAPVQQQVEVATMMTTTTTKDQMLESARLLAQTNDTKTLFECLTWAARSSFGSTVLRSQESGECLLFDDKINGTPEGSQQYAAVTSDYGQEEMYSSKRKFSEGRVDTKMSAKLASKMRYKVYKREIGQPSIGNQSQKTKQRDHDGNCSGKKSSEAPFLIQQLSLMNEAILRANRAPNSYQACVDETHLARDIRFSPAKVLPVSELLYGKSARIPHKSGFRYTFLSDSNDTTGITGDNNGDSQKRVQIRALTEVGSFAQCSIDCDEEPTCAAFAYCRYPESGHQYCQLSNLKLNFSHPNKNNNSELTVPASQLLANQSIVRDSNCNLHAKDYLLYFETDSKGIELISRGDGEVSRRIEWRLVASDITQLDCASACYIGNQQRASESCMRFTHCPEFGWCFHWLVGAQQEQQQEQQKATDAALATLNSTKPNSLAAATACSYFKRKAVSLYKRTIFFEDLEWTGKNLYQAKVAHLSKNLCAEKCTVGSECQSFDECRVVLTKKSSSSATTTMTKEETSEKVSSEYTECVLLGGSVFDGSVGIQLVNLTTTSSAIYDIKKHCNHFERLAAKQRLSAQQVKLLVELVSKGKADNNLAATSEEAKGFTPGSPYAVTLFYAALFGLAIGSGSQGLMLVWKQQRNKRRGLGNRSNGSSEDLVDAEVYNGDDY